MQAARTAGPLPGMPAAVAEALRRGALVLTANQRAARSLRFAFDAAQRLQGRASQTPWAPATILPLQTWLQSLWQQLLLDGAEARLLLNSTQQHTLWREIIAADPDVSTVRSVDTLAELAARAWHLLHLYSGSHDDPDFSASTDTRAFARWASQFAQVCRRELFLTAAELPLALKRALTRRQISLTAPVLLLVDFDHHPPAHQLLFAELRRAGIPLEETQTSSTTATASLHTAPEPRLELRAAIDWARKHIEASATTRIAIVVPDLANRKPSMERMLRERLNPAWESLDNRALPLFEFSLGQPLAQTGPVLAALDLLAWSFGPLPLDRVSHLLLSPFLTSTGELAAAARFDALELRTAPLLRPELSLDQTLSRMLRFAATPSLLQRLLSAKEQALAGTHAQTYAAHAEHFAGLLDAAGWTRATPADSVIAQIRRRWESALDELATLDFRPSAARPTVSAALEALTRIARQAVFAPQSRNAPVQILGPLELGGLPFDALWFLSADDRTWPPRATPHPLLPRRLQRRLGMPGANAADDDRTARTLTRRIAHSAPEIVFSYAQRYEDADRHPSTLLRDLGLTPTPSVEPPSEALPDLYLRLPEAAGLPPLPDTILRGGERVLKDQAACAFRAFAEHRLWSTDLPSRDPGFNPRDRGSLVHRILEVFWARVQDRTTLHDLPLAERHAILDEAINLGLERSARQIQSAWDSAYLDVERERLRHLVRPWLDLELKRPDFRVQQQEQRLTDIALGGVRLDLRVDRVDDTPAGPLILDYKTGSAKPSEWLTDRPDAPQLPLYAVFNRADRLGGVAFALLRAGNDLGMTGFSDHPSAVFPRSAAARTRLALADQREEWLRVLTALASAFSSGDTRVQPKKYPGTCKHCAQRLLCRLDSTHLTTSEDEHEEEAVAHV